MCDIDNPETQHIPADADMTEPCGVPKTTEVSCSVAQTVQSSSGTSIEDVCSIDSSSSTADRRRSKSGKRRSGFSRGRISITQLSKDYPGACDSDGSELYKQISEDLPPAKRLCVLSRLALRHTLETLDKEFEDVPGFETFKGEALTRVGDVIDKMEAEGSFEEACTGPSLAPNPLNLQMNLTISQLTQSFERMRKESENWDELCSRLQTQADNAKQHLNDLNMDYSAIPDDVKELANSFLPSPSHTPDFEALSLEAVQDVKTISLLMDEYCQNVEMLNTASRAAQKYMDNAIQVLDHENGCKRQDLRDSIQQLLST